MKILYGIQGTGNGHITKAIEIIPHLKKRADVDAMVSGNNFELALPFEIKYNLKGITFLMNKTGGIDYTASLRNLNLSSLLHDIKNIPITDYDLVITDFEPLSAYAARKKNIPVIGFGHQASFAYLEVPMAKSLLNPGRWVLKNFVRCNHYLGVHFRSYHPNIVTPVIRQKIRDLQPSKEKFVLTYLPAMHEEAVFEVVKYLPSIHFVVFSKYAKKPENYKNMEVMPLSEDHFIEYLKKCSGVITNAGFETPAEALYLGKKLMVIPVKGQYEQQCNALALSFLGIPVLKSFDRRAIEAVKSWYHGPDPKIEIQPADTHRVVQKIMDAATKNEALQKKIYFNNVKEFPSSKLNPSLEDS